MHLWHTIGYVLDMTIFGPFIGHLLLIILIGQLSSFFFNQLKLLGLNGNLFDLTASGSNFKLRLHFVINSAYWVPDIKGELGPTYEECQNIG